MILGLSSFTYAWAVGIPGHVPARPLDGLALLQQARQHGLSLLQIGDNLPLHNLENAELDRLALRARESGIRLEIGARGLTSARVADYVRIARRLDARLVRFVIDDIDYQPSPDAITGILRESAPALNDLTLGIENHDRFPAVSLRALVESAGCDRIGICLDTVNSLGAGEGLDTVVAALAPLTVNLHIKDFHITRASHRMGFTVEGRPAGEGMLNIPQVLRQLAPFHRCRSAILELWTPPEPRLDQTLARESDWATRSLEFLKPLFPAGYAE